MYLPLIRLPKLGKSVLYTLYGDFDKANWSLRVNFPVGTIGWNYTAPGNENFDYVDDDNHIAGLKNDPVFCAIYELGDVPVVYGIVFKVNDVTGYENPYAVGANQLC